jgi:hypothetical protein
LLAAPTSYTPDPQSKEDKAAAEEALKETSTIDDEMGLGCVKTRKIEKPRE